MLSCGPVGGNQWSSREVAQLDLGFVHLFLSAEGSGVARWTGCVPGSTVRDLSPCSFGRRISVLWELALWVDPKPLTGARLFIWSPRDLLEVQHWHSDAM